VRRLVFAIIALVVVSSTASAIDTTFVVTAVAVKPAITINIAPDGDNLEIVFATDKPCYVIVGWDTDALILYADATPRKISLKPPHNRLSLDFL